MALVTFLAASRDSGQPPTPFQFLAVIDKFTSDAAEKKWTTAGRDGRRALQVLASVLSDTSNHAGAGGVRGTLRRN